MRAWLRFSGRMRRLRHCEGEEETAFKMTPVLENLQLPRTKKRPPESVTSLTLTDDWLSDMQPLLWALTPKCFSHFVYKTGYGESVRKMGPEISDWRQKARPIQHLLWQFVERRLSGQICDCGEKLGFTILCLK